MKVVAVSDVTLGYGTPQLPLLVGSLAQHYSAEAHIVEPAQPELAQRHDLFPDFQIHRVLTGEHPHSKTGRSEYIWRAASVVNDLKPDVVVACCTFCLPVVFKLKHKPRRTIYYSVESIRFYGRFDIEMNRRAAPLLDVILFPEENRAAIEVKRCGFPNLPKLVIYNVSNAGQSRSPLPKEQRNGRILYSGTISRENTYADYYLTEKVRELPIDLFGPVKEDPRSIPEGQRFVDQLRGNVRYGGYLSGPDLAERRPAYLYSIVNWNPREENQRFAAPNKFFESITAGVPPIAAPHPQCKQVIERYQCGLLMRNWSHAAFVEALRRGLSLVETGGWQRMVNNCVHAASVELNWNAQFSKLIPYL